MKKRNKIEKLLLKPNLQMKNEIIAILIGLFFISSCKVDCPDKTYILNIALGNNTEFSADVIVFPKQSYIHGVSLYKMSDIGGGYNSTYFTMEPKQPSMGSFRHVLFTTVDITIDSNLLLDLVFDSIQIIINDSISSRILFSPEKSTNYSLNPNKSDSVWLSQLLNSDKPNNDCENLGETMSYRFYIEQDLINK